MAKTLNKSIKVTISKRQLQFSSRPLLNVWQIQFVHGLLSLSHMHLCRSLSNFSFLQLKSRLFNTGNRRSLRLFCSYKQTWREKSCCCSWAGRETSMAREFMWHCFCMVTCLSQHHENSFPTRTNTLQKRQNNFVSKIFYYKRNDSSEAKPVRSCCRQEHKADNHSQRNLVSCRKDLPSVCSLVEQLILVPRFQNKLSGKLCNLDDTVLGTFRVLNLQLYKREHSTKYKRF